MKSTKLISCAIAMLFCFITYGQKRRITGTVYDAIGPLPNASVVIKGTGNSVQADGSGKYAIKAHTGDILVFSSLGYITKMDTISNSNLIDVILASPTSNLEKGVIVKNEKHIIEENAKAQGVSVIPDAIDYSEFKNSTKLDEVVVGAMGIVKRKDAVSSSQSEIKTKELTQAGNPSALSSMTGKVSGLQINKVSNGVNPELTVVLRCYRSISGNNQALIVIDNAISDAQSLNMLPTDLIESVNVIKGPQGAALYGSQGVNGVIMVTTKKGTFKSTDSDEEEKDDKKSNKNVNEDETEER